MSRTHLFCIYFLISNLLIAQKKQLHLIVQGKDSTETVVLNNYLKANSFKTYKDLKEITSNITKELIKSGYIDVALKRVKRVNDTLYNANYILSTKIDSVIVRYDPKAFEADYLIESFINDNNEIIIPYENIEAFMNQLNLKFSNQGASFNKIKLVNLQKVDNTIIANLHVSNLQDKRTIDTIIIKGYEKFPKSYLRYYSKLKIKNIFNKESLLNKESRLNNLSFVESLKPPEVLFTSDSTKVFLYLKKKSANSFDGFLGFSTNEQSGNLELNGYVNLSLINNLNIGERLTIIYKNDGEDQQRFNTSISIPYIFSSPFGIEADLKIFKQDSTFLNTEQSLSANYIIGEKINTSVGYQTINSSNLLDQSIANINDYKARFINASIEYTTPVDIALFTEPKTNYSLNIAYGNRETNSNRTTQVKGTLSLLRTIRLNSRNYITLGSNTSILHADNYLTNELYRTGGLQSIRGFEENSIFASLYSLLTTEYRYILSPNIFAHSVIDFGYVENNITDVIENLNSIGIGLGIRNRSGLLRLIFANGKRSGQSFEFNNTKVHISLLANF
ncbi:hypothetical protein [Aquimarina brevivitae]|uniref:Outer membrane protein assembly factor BamA n=1 Tax=Aquimarina brevivitae TaxID=323412 RepID=A0A4Q7PHC9_9FLAO|nr:hypothetical protein [Aquimarina brevivitae]RZS99944.1 outer membrane protein assembly factor BamA [Aquimarina brevivitae]